MGTRVNTGVLSGPLPVGCMAIAEGDSSGPAIDTGGSFDFTQANT